MRQARRFFLFASWLILAGFQSTAAGQIPQSRSTTINGPQGLLVTGKVVMEDGARPPGPVTIETCVGKIYTDSTGAFTLELGGSRVGNVQSDARAASNDSLDGPASRIETTTTCDLVASMTGYRSQAVSLTGRRTVENPDVGTLVLRRIGNAPGGGTPGGAVKAASVEPPKDAKKAYEKGRDELLNRKLDNAEKELRKAVDIFPKYAVAWYALGMLMETRKDTAPAREAYNKAVAADPGYAQPYVKLAGLAAHENKWEEALEASGRAIQLDPAQTQPAYMINTMANLNLGHAEAAEKTARELQKMDSKHQFPMVELILAQLLADRQDFAGEAARLRDFLQFAPKAPNAEAVRARLAELEKMGKNK
jgi:tetratricopeptide (TPR) repeat protein